MSTFPTLAYTDLRKVTGGEAHEYDHRTLSSRPERVRRQDGEQKTPSLGWKDFGQVFVTNNHMRVDD